MGFRRPRYLGVQPFQTSDQHIFFGRDEDIENLHDFILLEKLIVLFGKSGYGKSSLLNAGILPRLMDEKQPFDFRFRPIEVRFTNYIEGQSFTTLETLKRLLRDIKVDENSAFLKQYTVQKDSYGEDDTLWLQFKQRQTATNGQFVLIFDQFEEFFSYPAEQQEGFRKQLAELFYTDIPQSVRANLDKLTDEQRRYVSKPMNIKAVFAIRSDRMSYLDSLKDELPAILHKRYELRPLTSSQARDAIIKPASIKDDTFYTPPFEYTEGGLNSILNALSSPLQSSPNGRENTGTTLSPLGRAGEGTGIEAFQLQIVCEYIEGLVKEGKVPDLDGNGLPDITEAQLPEMAQLYENYYYRKLSELNEDIRPKAQRVLEDALLAEDTATGEGRRKSVDSHDLLQMGLTDKLLTDLEKTYLIRREVNTVGGFSFEISHDTLVLPIQKAKKERQAIEEKERLAKEQVEKEKQLEEAKRLAKIETRRRQLATFLSILSVLGLGIATWFYFDADKAKKNAFKAKTKAEESEEIAKDFANQAIEANSKAKAAQMEAEKQAIEAKRSEEIAIKATKQAQANLIKMQEAQAAKNAIEIAKYLSAAQRMINLGKYDFARQILEEALVLDKNNPLILNKLKEIEGK